MKDLFGPPIRQPVRPPVDAVARLRQVLGTGATQEEARRLLSAEIDGEPLAPRSASAPSGGAVNRFRPSRPAQARGSFNAVAHYALAAPKPIGRGKRGEVVIGYTLWPDSDERCRYNGTLHIAGLGQSTINLSFDALAGILAAAPAIEAYLAEHGSSIAAAESVAHERKKALRRSRSRVYDQPTQQS